jgi:phage shock protein C
MELFCEQDRICGLAGGFNEIRRRVQTMICRNCQKEMADGSNFCNGCGARQHVPSQGTAQASRRLMRSVTDRKFAGVCGGIAEYFDIDSTTVRLLWVLAVILPIPLVPAFLGYFVAWIVMPKAPLPSANPLPPPVIIPSPPQTA